MKFAHDAAAELFLEGVDPQEFLVVATVVPTSKVEEWDTGFLVTEKVMPMKVAIRTSDQVPCRCVAVLTKERGGMQQSCSFPGP